ncbi:MAG TPA: hypothetical protein PK054_12255 [Anaerohalosphaeraceae bacterium]|nr:hypothetical protein [Anaerohalosphaeraceae bacterium]HOL90015.1 hypothetical protein [Anaerohalosphaeraceae bacterium]HPP57338.1 hypothetical protein [Anaerohalosphaeraceae bacterium]
MKQLKTNLFLFEIYTGFFPLLTALAAAHTMSPNEYLIWGIPSEELAIPAGAVITEAVLTIHDIVPAKARIYVHLLDNPTEGVQRDTGSGSGDIFAGYGVSVTGAFSNKGKWVCRLSQNNNKKSTIWTIFPNPYKVKLADGSTVSLSSSLLELTDYIGNGSGFGFGLNFKDICTFTQITLDVTAKTYLGDYQVQTFSFRISDLYSYNESSGKWEYSAEAEPADWEQNDEPSLPVTIKSVQVAAGNGVGQDSLTVSGSFAAAPNLLQVPSIETSVVSLTDGAEIYTEECGYKWDKTKNQFVWTRKIAKNQPGGITSLKFDFAKCTFAMTLSKTNLTGLSCPIRFEWDFGDTVYYGEADESIVNGKQRIPIRLMRNYRDEVRISKAAAKHGKTAGTDQVSITGEIAVADVAGTDLTALPVSITWGAQTFTIPEGSFTKAAKGNVYSCLNVPAAEGGLVSCKIDLDKCIFSVILKNAVLDLVPGTAADANLQIGRAAD